MKINNLTFSVAMALLMSTSLYGTPNVFTGSQANNIVPGAEKVREGNFSSLPSYVKLRKGSELPIDAFVPWLKQQFSLSEATDFQLIRSEKDELGHQHYRYQQTVNGIPLMGGIYIAHTYNNQVYSMNGELYNDINVASASMSEAQALGHALNHIGATTYKWELPGEERHVKFETGNPNATYYPDGELMYAPRDAKFDQENYRLAYKFNIYAHAPLYRAEVFVDAITGEILFENEKIHHADAQGTAVTAYNGNQTITADSFGGGFRLRESGRGNGVNTWDMNEGTNYGNAVDFTDADNFWNNANAQLDEYATDAHWGAEMTYDYFFNVHNRNSIDGNGFALNSYVHYDQSFANAFWDGQRMTYGDGGGGWNPLTAIDIAGHEIGHGLTTFTADLVYQDEPGALNESFSDIFGEAIEFYGTNGNGDWLMGADIGSALRSMSNPNAYGDPDTYFGTNWAPLGGGDNGGVHTNSGVQNYWFYLLSEGGSGTNDNGDAFTVNPLGMTDASRIAFRNLTVYLSVSSQFADARFYAIQSAEDLFGPCTPEVEETTNAWYAVGVGDPWNPVVEAEFSASATGGCQTPFDVDFTNLTNNGGTYVWDFGDGNTSTSTDPSHTYTTPGAYTVTLSTNGACGSDTTVKVDHIYVGQLAPPAMNDGSRCDPGTVDLSGNGAGTLFWYDAAVGGNLVGTGNSFTTPSISSTTSYWVESATGLGPEYVGPTDNTFGNGGFFTGNQSLVFDVYRSVELVSVVVYANGGGNRTIELYDNNNNLVTSSTINLVDGQQRINLNWNLNPGTGYRITSPSPDLFRNSDGAVYPYEIQGLVSITGSTAGQPGYYYFFYGWELQEAPCSSPRTEVIAGIAASPTTNDSSRCGTGTVDLSANGSGVGDLNWYDAAVGGNQVNTGNNFTTPSLGATTTYYVEEVLPGPTTNVGPVDNTFGGGGFFTGDQHLIFDCATPLTLKSVMVYANGAGNRTIELRDNGGTVLQDTTINIPSGQQRVELNFALPVANNLQLGTTPGPDLFRNNSGPAYPYSNAGVTITNSSAGTDFYYFFYDWELQEAPCITARTPVTAFINPPSGDATITQAGPFCPSDAALNLNAVDPGGTWSGTGITDVNNGTFDPGTAGIGTHVITYIIPGTCGDTGTVSIAVNTNFDATISPAGPFCENDGSLNLTAVDGGGTWSGTGITDGTNGTFDPATAGIGSHTITYTIPGNCGDVQTETIQVIATPDASISAAGPFCASDGALNLTAVDGGGTWSGTGITDGTNGTFDPATAGSGSHVITYSVTVGGCSDVQTTTIVVNPDMDATITATGPYCTADNPLNLTATDQGGVWAGTGIVDVNNGTFDPANAGVGNHTVIYTISGACGDADTVNIDVLQSADATITAAGPFCDNDPATNLNGAEPGGTWSGTGIIDANNGTFDPVTAGLGTHTVTYTIPGTCGDQQSINIVVQICTGVEENADGSIFNVYPNPSGGLFTIALSNPNGLDGQRVEITNAIGEIVFFEQLQSTTTYNKEVSLDTHARGVYFVRVSGEKTNIVQKLILH